MSMALLLSRHRQAVVRRLNLDRLAIAELVAVQTRDRRHGYSGSLYELLTQPAQR